MKVKEPDWEKTAHFFATEKFHWGRGLTREKALARLRREGGTPKNASVYYCKAGCVVTAMGVRVPPESSWELISGPDIMKK